MQKFFWYIYVQPLRRIALIMVLLVFLWGWVKNIIEDHYGWRILNAVVITISLIAIIYFTLFSRNEGITDLVLIPFQTFVEAKKQPELYRSMLMNVFLFVPLGLTAPNVLSRWKRFWPAVITVVSAFVFSTAIEFSQYYFHLGRCEVDDVIMNTIGAAMKKLTARIYSMLPGSR